MSGGTDEHGTGAAPPGWYPTGDGRTAWWDGERWHLDAPPPSPQVVPGYGPPGVYGPPPGYGPPGGSGSPAGYGYGPPPGYAVGPRAPYVPIRSMTAAVQAFAIIIVVCQAISFLIDLWGFTVVADADVLTPSLLDRLDTLDVAYALVSLPLTLSLLVNLILFLIWRHRVQRNLGEALGVAYLEYTPGWTVGWWFVPLANLVKPKQTMNEAWTASEPSDPPGSADWRQRKAPPLVSWWWACLLGAWFVSFFGDGNTPARFTADAGRLRLDLVAGMVTSALYVACGVLFLKLLRGITDRMAERARRLGMGNE